VFAGTSPSDYVRDLNRIGQVIGWKELAERCAVALDTEYCATAFAMACEISMIDGDLSDSEREILEHVAGILSMESGMAKKIVEVYEVRMRFQRRT